MDFPVLTYKMAVALQFHKGDKEDAMDLANLIADIEPEKNNDVVFILFGARNLGGVKNHKDILEAKQKLSEKFHTILWDSYRFGDGYPHGPNDMWYELNQRVLMECREKRFLCECLFTIEGDACPTKADWLSQIYNEWKSCGKEVLGCISTFTGTDDGLHVNGNMVLPYDFCYRNSLWSCPAHIAWDVYNRNAFMRSACNSKLIFNEYRCREEKIDQYLGNPKSLPVYLHGYKGEKLRNYIRAKIKKPV